MLDDETLNLYRVLYLNGKLVCSVSTNILLNLYRVLYLNDTPIELFVDEPFD